MKYPEGYINKVICGDCIEVMRGMPVNRIDTIITDSPYNLIQQSSGFERGAGKESPYTRTAKGGFMGKQWDGTGIAFKPETWQEVLRIAKPGATLMAFGGTRTYHRMACAIEDAGWVLKDCIMWLYGSGFPKATDISKQLDKRNGRFYDKNFKNYCNEQRKKLGYSHNKVNELIGSAITGGGFSSNIMGNNQQNELPTLEMYKKLKPILKLNNRFDELMKRTEAEREKLGIKTKRTVQNWMPTSKDNNTYITEAQTSEAKLWNGWKSHGLKPAYEPIIVAMKPNEGSYAENALKHGVSGLNIDGGRIGYKSDKDKESARWGNDDNAGKTLYKGGFTPQGKNIIANIQGRFPANVILDEGAGRLLDEQSGISKSTGGKAGHTKAYSGGYKQKYYGDLKPGLGDSGGASRFFYCAKASKSERNIGCEGMDNKNPCYESHRANYKTTHGIETPYAGTGRSGNNFKNNHPTVKPLALMKYLCTLTKTPTGGIVLDPFAGSGTTCIAAKLTGRDYIGIEKEAEYVKIAKARIKAAIAQGVFEF